MGVSDSCHAIVALLCYGFALIQLFNDATQCQQFFVFQKKHLQRSIYHAELKLVNKGIFICIFCESIEIWYRKLANFTKKSTYFFTFCRG